MRTKITILILISLTCTVLVLWSHPNLEPKTLSRGQILALVAGQCIPDVVLAEIQARGIRFTPDENFKSLLKNAGADRKVLSALNTAKIVPAGKTEEPEDPTFLQRLSNAGKFYAAKQLEDVTSELTHTFTTESEKSAAGFVIGMILIDQGRLDAAHDVYSQVLRQNPNFPQAHLRLSLIYENSDNPQQALGEAKAAVAELPTSPVAHLNVGASLSKLGQYKAAKSEFLEAIRLKPDFALAYRDLGNVLENSNDAEGAIAQYRKAIELDPSNLRARYDLGSLLVERDPAAAIVEFHKILELAPDWPICHECLANALYRVGRRKESEDEYRVAISLDPTSPSAHRGLGFSFEAQKRYDDALDEYREAQKADGNDSKSFTATGRVLLAKKDFPAAIAELKRAEALDPSDWQNYDFHGQALEASGDRDSAIEEYREALSVAPKQLQARLDLAAALEKKGDWVSALDNYRQAAVDEPPRHLGVPEISYDAQRKYVSAKERYNQHLVDLRSSGKSAEATALEAGLKQVLSAPNLDTEFHEALLASSQAFGAKNFDSAETSAKHALQIAEKIQPPDGRLPEALSQLGTIYANRAQYPLATEMFKRQLAEMEKLHGPASPMLDKPLQNLASLAARQKDFSASEAYLQRALEIDRKSYGELSVNAADALRLLSTVYLAEKDYAKSEAALLQVIKDYETIYNPDDQALGFPLAALCFVYDQWEKPEKAAACHGRMVSIAEKNFGAESSYLVPDLTAEAKALRKLGRNNEAAKLEQRAASIPSAQTQASQNH